MYRFQVDFTNNVCHAYIFSLSGFCQFLPFLPQGFCHAGYYRFLPLVFSTLAKTCQPCQELEDFEGENSMISDKPRQKPARSKCYCLTCWHKQAARSSGSQMRSTRQWCNKKAVFWQITRSGVLQAIKCEQAHLIFDSGRDVKPVELIPHESVDMIGIDRTAAASISAELLTHDAIQSTDELRRRSIQQTVAVRHDLHFWVCIKILKVRKGDSVTKQD